MAVDRTSEPQRRLQPPDRSAVSRPPSRPPAPGGRVYRVDARTLLPLQRLAGNAAVTSLVTRTTDQTGSTRAPANLQGAGPAVQRTKIAIATVKARPSDTQQSIMERALITELAIPKAVATKFASQLLYAGAKPVPGEMIPVYLDPQAMAVLREMVSGYEEGGRDGADPNRDAGGDQTDSDSATSEGGLGLIRVPSWVVTTLKVLDGGFTIASVIMGAGPALALVKGMAKWLIAQGIKRLARRAAKEVAEEAAEEALRKVSKKAAREGLEQAVYASTKEELKRRIKQSTLKAAREALEDSMKGASKKELRKAAAELAEEIAEQVSEKAARRAAAQAVKKATMGFLARSGVLRNAKKAQIPLEKLTGYVLNPNHPDGGHKAKIIKKLLGYDHANYAGFLKQLQRGVANTPAVLGKVDQHGQRFTVYINMTGPSGSAVVETGWIFRPGSKVPQLTTAFIP